MIKTQKQMNWDSLWRRVWFKAHFRRAGKPLFSPHLWLFPAHSLFLSCLWLRYTGRGPGGHIPLLVCTPWAPFFSQVVGKSNSPFPGHIFPKQISQRLSHACKARLSFVENDCCDTAARVTYFRAKRQTKIKKRQTKYFQINTRCYLLKCDQLPCSGI